MNILIVHNTSFPPEIGKTDVIYYLKYFEKFNNGNIELFCYGMNKKITNTTDISGIKLFFKKGILIDLYLSIKSAIHIFKYNKKYDYIYILNPLFFGIIPAIAGKILKKKIVFDLRTGPISNHRIVSKFVILLDSLIISLSDYIIFINASIYYKLGYFGLGNKIIHETLLGHEIINSKNIPTINLNSPANKYTFIYIGTLSRRRELSYLIEAFNTLSDSCELYILGTGDDEGYLRSIAYENIQFLGQVKHEDVSNFINSVNFGISFIPITEQYNLQPPLKTIEYLGLGKPVLGTNTEGNKKFLNPDNSVLIENYRSKESILKGVKGMVNKDFLVENIKTKSMEYSWENIIKKLINHLT